MDVRTKTLFSSFVRAVAVVGLRLWLLPSSPDSKCPSFRRPSKRPAAVDLPDLLPRPANVLPRVPIIPAVILSNPQILQRRIQADASSPTRNGFRNGKRYYQAKDLANARRNSTAPST